MRRSRRATITLLMFMLVPALSLSQGSWIEIGLRPTSSPVSMISYRDSLHFCLTSPQGNILYTSDGGWSWLSDSIPSAYPVVKCKLVSDSVLWAFSSQGRDTTRTSEIFRSTDAGRSWLAAGPPDSLTVIGADFTSENIAWCVSFTHLWATTDGGLSWHQRGSFKKYSSKYRGVLHDLHFFDREAGYLGGAFAFGSTLVFQSTSDGGWTWDLGTLPSGAYFEGAGPLGYMGDSTCSFSYSYYSEMVNHPIGGFVLTWNRLKDFVLVGPNWYNPNAPEGGWIGPYRDGFALDRKKYWLLTSMTGTIRRTLDSGTTWQVDSFAVPIRQIVGDKLGLRLALGSGRLFKSREIINDVESAPMTPASYSLQQNYPNPFNPSTTIRYSVPTRSRVNLMVFNALGQQVAVLHDGEVDTGYHEVSFDARALSSGVYFYRLIVGAFNETKRLLLMR